MLSILNTRDGGKQMELNFVTQEEQITMAIHKFAPTAEIGNAISECYDKLWDYIIKNGGQVCAEPYVAYLSQMDGGWDMEIGFPVAAALQGEGEINSSKIPSGKCATATLKGSYSQSESFWSEVWAEIMRLELKPNGAPREHYLNDPSMIPEDELLTKVMVPIED